ncbi:MAG: cytochrome c biogenesis protein CcdA [Lachnospiraceae bacterium]|nr:cytochrome c biogenesis protein CcdA [Lachnospiraceae bacterium]
MGFSLGVSVPAATVFFQGLISFFSPCVLPLLPLYIGYLSGGTGVRQEDGRIHYQRGKVMLHTLFFVLGVSFTFFLLGLGMSAVGTFFRSRQMLFARIGGILVVLFGLYQLGIFGASKMLSQEKRLPFQLGKLAMSPLTAFLMGFTFSFAWTPCVGPALTSVLLMAASAADGTMGFLLIGVYTLGFVLPFLAVGLFTTSLLELFRKHRNVVQYTAKLGGILMVFMGVMMVTGKMNAVTGYLSNLSLPQSAVETTAGAGGDGAAGAGGAGDGAVAGTENGAGTDAAAGTSDETETSAEDKNKMLPEAVDFELVDQYGNKHTLADYKGKTVFLNFWATWCPPCRAEMPDIQKLYETYDTEGDDALIVLGVAAPNVGQETDEAGIAAFLEENGYTYPVLMDPTGELFSAYGISSFPTTFMINRDGYIFGYVSGMLSEDMMQSIISQTMEGKREKK